MTFNGTFFSGNEKEGFEITPLDEKISYQRWDFPEEIEERGFRMIGFVEVKDVKQTIRDFIEELETKILINWKGPNELIDFIEKAKLRHFGKELI